MNFWNWNKSDRRNWSLSLATPLSTGSMYDEVGKYSLGCGNPYLNFILHIADWFIIISSTAIKAILITCKSLEVTYIGNILHAKNWEIGARSSCVHCSTMQKHWDIEKCKLSHFANNHLVAQCAAVDWLVFVQIAECICLDCKMYLSKLWNVFCLWSPCGLNRVMKQNAAAAVVVVAIIF